MDSRVTLYSLSEEISAALQAIELAETEEEREQIALEVKPTFDAMVRKVDSFSSYCAHLEAQIDLASKEEKRLSQRRRSMESALSRLEGYALNVMQGMGVEKLNGETNTLSIRKNAPSVSILNESAIPPRFIESRTTMVVDKNAIKAALKAGQEVPGEMLTQGFGLKRS